MILIIENNKPIEMETTLEEVQKAVSFYRKERERNRLDCKRRYELRKTGNPRGRPKKTTATENNA